ncbi:MAG: ABC-F family ATP-binding cassette domain-containing protein [Pseudomonadota bacterium]
MLTISDLSARIAGRLLIDHASLTLPDGAKAGLVGRNGAGKSTLFRIVSGELAAETGSVAMPKNRRIGQVLQEAPGTDEPLIDIVLKADTERLSLLEEAKSATDAGRIADIQTRLSDIDAHSAEARAATILAGLGFDPDAQARPAAEFSGGWRMRVALAAVLFAKPDLLLLDEPTNYLDLEGTLWLEDYVRRYPHTVIIISHDRDLLNNAVNSIVHLEQKKLVYYRGTFDQFERHRADARELQMKAREKQQARAKHMQAFVERFRYKASKARQAQSRLKAIERMGEISAVVDEHVQAFRFPATGRRPASPIIAMETCSVGYTPGDPILSQLNLRIDTDDRIALLGANGNGKSTFAKLLCGKLVPEKGVLTRAPHLATGYFAQHQLDELVPAESAVEHVRKILPDAPVAELRSRVAGIGLSTEKMDTPARDLSGGEKARLLMGLATLNGANLIILDEPTNHLDIDSRAALIDALNAFDGAVILISHDRYLIEATADRLWLVRDGTVGEYEGDLDDYRALIVSANRTQSRSKAIGETSSKADQRRAAAEKRLELAPLKKEITAIEDLTAELERKIESLERDLSDVTLYERAPGEAAEKAKACSDAKKQLADAEDKWLLLSTELEQASADESN